jgi:integrase
VTKNGNGEGGITCHKKSGLYMARYTVQTSTGPKRKTLYGKTRREVDEKLTAAKADRDKGLLFDADSLTVGRYLERWLAVSVRDTVKATTYETYERLMRLHLVPTLGRVKRRERQPTGSAVHRRHSHGIAAG